MKGCGFLKESKMNNEPTVKQLEAMVAECFRLREQYQEAKKVSGEYYKKLTEMQNQVIEVLTELGKTSYVSDVGTFSFKVQESFRVPKTPEARKMFFDFLKEKGIYDDMISVNSMTLNSWAKAEIESSDSLDYQIPGLEKSEPSFKASMRAK